MTSRFPEYPLASSPPTLSRSCASLAPPQLRFSSLAWLKLQYLCHIGRTEVGAFGISAAGDLLYVEQVETLMQGATAVSIEFSDTAVADHFDRFADQNISPGRCGRIWIHTHPGASAQPSSVDESTFARVFGPSDWAVMFILSRTGQTYARLRFSAGPGGEMTIPVSVDWSSWPGLLGGQSSLLPDLIRQWRQEYDSNVFDLTTLGPSRGGEAEYLDEQDVSHRHVRPSRSRRRGNRRATAIGDEASGDEVATFDEQDELFSFADEMEALEIAAFRSESFPASPAAGVFAHEEVRHGG